MSKKILKDGTEKDYAMELDDDLRAQYNEYHRRYRENHRQKNRDYMRAYMKKYRAAKRGETIE